MMQVKIRKMKNKMQEAKTNLKSKDKIGLTHPGPRRNKPWIFSILGQKCTLKVVVGQDVQS